MKYQVVIQNVIMDDDGYEKIVDAPNGWTNLQSGTCPDCGQEWSWAENGNVPGTRKCKCGSLFSAVPVGEGVGRVRKERMY